MHASPFLRHTAVLPHTPCLQVDKLWSIVPIYYLW